MSESDLPSLSKKNMLMLSELITDQCGIKMPPTKKFLLESRLQKRLRVLGLKTFEEYCDYLFSDEGKACELIHCIDLVTTNKTDFFREPSHFDHLIKYILPAMLQSSKKGTMSHLRVWSAGCSTGAEPYTLAMVLKEFEETQSLFNFSILATDISTLVLDEARSGVYDEATVAPVPDAYKSKYLLQSRDRKKQLVRIVPELRKRIAFNRLNFMDDHFKVQEKMDVIFCRNVLIYFDRETQEKVINKLCSHLVSGGYLFLGHSETINGIDAPLESVGNTIYKRT